MRNLHDGTLQDIQHICSSMEQLLLSYRFGEVPYIYIANFLELLFQSARTRICVLSKPTSNREYSRLFSIEELDQLVVFATFRKPKVYRAFLEQLSSQLYRCKADFWEDECEHLETRDKHFYICLARVYPESNEVIIGRHRSKEPYRRLATLLHLLTEESKTWGLDIPAALCNCFDNIPNQQKICKLCSENDFPSDQEKASAVIEGNPQSRVELNEKLLKPIEQCIEYIYEHNHGIPLLRVAQPNQPDTDMGYSNLFFFIRINDLPETEGHADDKFRVKLVSPPQQRMELSRFYHNQRQCQWHDKNGDCKISGMKECLFQTYWSQLPETVTDDDTLFKHYAPLWEQLTATSSSHFSKSETAFRSSSIVFDRRQKYVLENGGQGVVSGITERDSVGACITFRMMSLTSSNQSGIDAEDRIPQIMYVPIYAGTAPFVLAATVVNAQLPHPFNKTLSDWRRAYRFAGMVFQFMSSRLKESARKAYLDTASNMIQGFYEAYRSSIENPEYCNPNAQEEFLRHANKELDDLSKIYPYHKIILANATHNVIKREGREIFETPEGITLQVALERNPYWRSFSDRAFFSTELVARKFYSGIARSVAFSEKEKREWQAFFFWHLDQFKVSPFSQNNWREYAAKKGWRSRQDDSDPPTGGGAIPDAKNNVVPFKK